MRSWLGAHGQCPAVVPLTKRWRWWRRVRPAFCQRIKEGLAACAWTRLHPTLTSSELSVVIVDVPYTLNDETCRCFPCRRAWPSPCLCPRTWSSAAAPTGRCGPSAPPTFASPARCRGRTSSAPTFRPSRRPGEEELRSDAASWQGATGGSDALLSRGSGSQSE